MRMALRDFFMSARKIHQMNDDGALLDQLSPLLRGTVALAANKQWIDHVWYLRKLTELRPGTRGYREGTEFLSGVAKAIVVRNYVGHERMPIGQLYILCRGFVVKNWRFMGVGKVPFGVHALCAGKAERLA